MKCTHTSPKLVLPGPGELFRHFLKKTLLLGEKIQISIFESKLG